MGSNPTRGFVTGPAYGKIKLDAKVCLVKKHSRRELNCDVYLHVKGYALARVTHLDLEGDLPIKRGGYRPVVGIKGGMKIVLSKDERLIVEHPLFEGIGESWVYIGIKSGGIFIGFRKEIIKKLEAYAESLGIKPLKK